MLEISDLSENNWDLVAKSNLHDYRQYYFWGEFKKKFNWHVKRLIFSENGQQKCFQLLLKIKWPVIFVYLPGVNNVSRENLREIKKFIDSIYGKFFFKYIRIDCLNENENFSLNKTDFKKCLFKKNGNIFLSSPLENTLDHKLNKSNRKWRNHYKQSLKNQNIIIRKNLKPDPDIVYQLSKDLEKRKKLGAGHSISEVDYLIRNLDDKLYFIQAELDNEILGFRAAIKLNNQAWDFFSITTLKGRKHSIGHRLTLEIYQALQDLNINKYQYIGENDEKMKHVYEFKTGTNPYIKKYVGEIEWSNSILTKLFLNLYLLIFFSNFTPSFLKKTH